MIAPPTARAHVAWVGERRWNQASVLLPLSRLAPPCSAASHKLNGGCEFRAFTARSVLLGEETGHPRLRLAETAVVKVKEAYDLTLRSPRPTKTRPKSRSRQVCRNSPGIRPWAELTAASS